MGRENLSLEGAVVELLHEREAPIYAEDWLTEIAVDEDRDGDLRLSALTLLGTIKSPPLLREIFPLLAARDSLNALPETEVLALNRWITNPAHLANVDWMLGQAKSGSTQQGSLAWHTLLSVVDDPGLEAETVARVETVMLETVGGGEEEAMILLNALETSAYSGKSEILAKAAENENVRVNKTAVALSEPGGEPEEGVEDAPLLSLESDGVIKLDSLGEGDIEKGEAVFSRLSCGDCHNIHGEGPALPRFGKPCEGFITGRTSRCDIASRSRCGGRICGD